MESGANPLYYTNNASSTYSPFNQSVTYSNILDKSGCEKGDNEKELKCLRDLSFDKFNSSVAGTYWRPVVDGSLLPMLSSQQIAEGNFVKVPLLLGSNVSPRFIFVSSYSAHLDICYLQTDEGTAFGLRKINTTDELVDSLALNYVALSKNSSAELVSRYSTEQSEGCPYNTGDGVLPTGIQDKVRFDLFSLFFSTMLTISLHLQRSLAINGDIQMTAPRRNLAEAASRYSPVYSYRFDTVPENATILSGVSVLSSLRYSNAMY